MIKQRILLAMSLVLLARTVSAGSSGFVSEYSSLAGADCKMMESGVDNGIQRCPAHDGYQVYIYGGEGTSSLVLKKGKEKNISFDPEAIKNSKLPIFSRPYVAGNSLEWRYDKVDGKKKLIGLIYRIGDQSWPEDQSYLFIVRAERDTFCPLGLAKTNEEARTIADSGKTCVP